MSKRSDRLSALLLALLPLAPATALGHAAFVEAEAVQAVRVEGRFESGEPMAGAQVTVYAPADPAEPWVLGQTDADGVFLFVPDDQPGRWAVQLRQAGHGGITYVERTANAAVLSAPPAPAPSPVQKTVMAACVVWGCIGTALYFRRGRTG
jgi:nickel transport protein